MDNQMKLHVLKIKPIFFWKVANGLKKAELRKNDRDFQNYDLIHFIDVNGKEFINDPNNIYQITDVLDASLVIPNLTPNDYVILSVQKCELYGKH